MLSPNTHHYISSLPLLLLHFVCGHHHFRPISYVPRLPVSQACRNESWGSVGVLCHWSVTCYALNTNCSSLMLSLDSNSSTRTCCCCSSEVRQRPVRTALPLRGYAYLAQVYHHFCQLSLLCKQALIFIGASPSHSNVLKHKATRAQGVVPQCAAYDCAVT